MRRHIIICLLLSITIITSGQWKLDKNRLITGGLMVVGGGAKGFNETLQFHPDAFFKAFPGASRQWFDPAISWRNKYKNGDPLQGAKFPLSTTVLVMFTDQYHLNNFIYRGAITSALVIKLGHKQKFIYYVLDFFYYTVCYQSGFAATYYPFK